MISSSGSKTASTVDIDTLRKTRLVQGTQTLVKVLAKGDLTKKLTIEAHAFSAAAKEAIEKAGGTVKLIEVLDRAVGVARKALLPEPEGQG